MATSFTQEQSSLEEQKKPLSEDELALGIGLLVFVLSLATFWGSDLLGWAITTNVWTHLATALTPVSKAYAKVPALLSFLLTYGALAMVLTAGSLLMGFNAARFFRTFSIVFLISYAAWIVGNWAYIAATPDKLKPLGISWSLNLTNEAGYIVALIFGLLIANFMPGFAAWLKDALRSELYVKTAVVILGGFLGITAAEQLRLATSVMFRGMCAIVEAYLIYWAVVYFVARKYFGFSREWSVPLASGISICGVSAAIATGSAIRARPVVPIMVSSLVVVFAVIELLVLPFVAQTFLFHEPMVAGAWMGLAVKTDGGAIAAGTITESLLRAKALAVDGINYQPGWILATTTTVKVFIDVFIGIWAVILAWIWSAKIEGGRGVRIRFQSVWERFPKFILGYLLTFAVVLALGLLQPAAVPRLKAAMGEANVFRVLFFVLTFFSIGVVSNFRRLWAEGIGKLALVYVVCLFGFIIWVGLLISWLFFHGVKPPTV